MGKKVRVKFIVKVSKKEEWFIGIIPSLQWYKRDFFPHVITKLYK